jgi:hypothetical protein
MGANDGHGANLHNDAASAADLKFLQGLPHARVRNFKSKSGTGNIGLLVPHYFRSSRQNEPRGFANFGNGAPGCYKATVNESETITEAQPICWVRSRSETSGFRAVGFASAAAPHIERS